MSVFEFPRRAMPEQPVDCDGNPIDVGDLVAFASNDPTDRHQCKLVTALNYTYGRVITGDASRSARDMRLVMKRPTEEQIERKFAVHNLDRWRAERDELRKKLAGLNKLIRSAERRVTK